jgi:hypothetical protein
MALAQTELPELKRFTFFVSRRFEEGRERFRLHMGYFATLAEAEEWLNVVREIYPGAWAGEAPGRKLRERATAAQVAQAQHAAGPQARANALVAPRAAPAAPPAAPPAAAPPVTPRVAPAPMVTPPVVQPPAALRVPVVHPAPAPTPRVAAAAVAAPVVARAPSAVVPPRAPVRPQPTAPAAAAQSAAAAARAPAKPAPAVAKPATAPAVAAARSAAVPQKPAAPAARSAPATVARATTAAPKGVFEDSNVREVLKALTDSSATGETRLMQVPPPPPRDSASAESGTLSDTQVLRLLEVRRAEGSQPPSVDAGEGSIPLLKPDDTGTRRALKEAVANNAPVAFAVQLQWSVQAVELDRVPPLAIFSAYTLYTVEGSRDGRKWYGLRLGFFSDAISAKQVAQYVRSEFASVAVVPVSPQEKARASDQEMAATLAAPVAARTDPMDEFKLLEDGGAPSSSIPAMKPKIPGKIPGRPVPKTAAGRAAARQAANASAPARARNGKVGARDKRGPQTLEETLEILGASQLSIDNGTGETINDSGVRHLQVEVQKNSPFSRLLERLSERMKKS